MAIEFWVIGKTKEAYLQEGMADYEKRCRRYVRTRSVVIPEPKHAARLPAAELRKQETAAVLDRLGPQDHLILLDEKGRSMDSRQFAALLEKRLADPGGNTVFLVGGPYGFDGRLQERADNTLSLSAMTFSHQLVRLLFWEQLYRGISIIRGLPYHND